MVWDGVEVTAQVRIYNLGVTSLEQPVHVSYCVVRAPLRAVCILFFSQIRLKDRFQYGDRSHLCHPIFDGRYPQRPLLTIWFWNQNPPARWGPLALSLHFLCQFSQPCFPPLCFDPRKTLPAHPAASAVGSA